MIGMKHIRQRVAQRKVAWANKIIVATVKYICRNLPANETVKTHGTTCLSEDFLELKTDRMSNKLLHTESAARFIHLMQVKLEYTSQNF
jgi:hypothetical protein